MLEGLQSPLTLTFPRGYNSLGQSLEFAWIIFTINNVSLWPESDSWEHCNPKTISFITTIKTNYQYNKSLVNSDRKLYYFNVLILSIVNPGVVGGWETALVLPISQIWNKLISNTYASFASFIIVLRKLFLLVNPMSTKTM